VWWVGACLQTEGQFQLVFCSLLGRCQDLGSTVNVTDAREQSVAEVHWCIVVDGMQDSQQSGVHRAGVQQLK
jgi:hypothetical protein